MHDTPGGQEEEALEEGVGIQVEHSRRVSTNPAADEHVTDLRDGGVGKHSLDIVLGERHGGCIDGGQGSDDSNDLKSHPRESEEEVHPGDHVNASRYHGGGVDESADGSGAFHGIGKPDVEGDLGRLSCCTHEEEEGDQGGQTLGDCPSMNSFIDDSELAAPDVDEDEKNSQDKGGIADTVDDEGFFAGVSGRVPLEPEPDEKIGAEPDSFPSDKHENEVGGHDQDEHGECKEVQVSEIARVSLVVPHVADRINMDEEADSGDDKGHDRRQGVELEGEVGAEPADLNPGEKVFNQRQCFVGSPEKTPEREGGNDEGSKDRKAGL